MISGLRLFSQQHSAREQGAGFGIRPVASRLTKNYGMHPQLGCPKSLDSDRLPAGTCRALLCLQRISQWENAIHPTIHSGSGN